MVVFHVTNGFPFSVIFTSFRGNLPVSIRWTDMVRYDSGEFVEQHRPRVLCEIGCAKSEILSTAASLVFRCNIPKKAKNIYVTFI